MCHQFEGQKSDSVLIHYSKKRYEEKLTHLPGEEL